MLSRGETTHYILCVALLLQNVFAVHAIRRRRIGASSPPRNFRCSSGLRPAPFLRKEPSLRAFLPAHTVILSRRRRISVLEAYETIGSKYQSAGIRCFSGLRPAPSQLGKQKEGPFMGRLRANFARLGNPMQDCQLRKEPYVTGFTFVSPKPHGVVPEPPSLGRSLRYVFILLCLRCSLAESLPKQ